MTQDDSFTAVRSLRGRGRRSKPSAMKLTNEAAAAPARPVLYFLGTGGASATRERDNTSLLIESAGDLFLIDCPGCIIPKIQSLDLDPRRIRSLFITHIHPDHIYGLPSLVHNMMQEDTTLRVYGSNESLEFCRRLLDLFGLRRDKIKYRLEFIPLAPEDKFSPLADLKSRSLAVRHKSSSLGIHANFEPGKVDLLYTGDTAIHPPLFKRFFGVDYLVHECSVPSRFFRLHPGLAGLHTHSLDLGRYAAQAEIRCLAPVHFFGEVDFAAKEIEQEIKSHYKGKLVIPDDLDYIELT